MTATAPFVHAERAFAARLAAALGRGAGVVLRGDVSRRPCAYASSFLLEEVDAALEDGRVLPLVVKDVAAAGMLAGARGAKPPFLLDHRREAAVYVDVLQGADLGTPRCYAVDREGDSCWLVLERVAGTRLAEVGGIDSWLAAARWLARLHATTVPAGPTPLLVYDRDYYTRWLERARAFTGGDQAVAAALERLASRYDRAIDRLLGSPQTLLHGEFYATNVLVRDDGGICALDWEMAALGPPAVDVAALSAGRWTPERQAQIAAAYHQGAVQQRLWRGSDGDWQATLDAARLHLAVQWLGWSRTWSPPAEQQHDWAAELHRLVDRI